MYERTWEGIEYNRDTVYRDIFLQELGTAIIDSKLRDIPPAIMQQLVMHLADMQLWKVIEIIKKKKLWENIHRYY